MPQSDGHGGEVLAPVTYLPGVAPERAAPRRAPGLAVGPVRPVAFSEEYWADDAEAAAVATSSRSGIDDAEDADDADVTEAEPLDRETVIANASASLTRSLGRRGLSIAEARAKLRSSGLADDEALAVIDDYSSRGWLDDSVLAEQLVHSATTRKDMGTRAVRQLLVKRLVAREAIDAVIAELPDDDAERALEFARGKARSLVRFDDDTATRRLMGMLARRGFGGSTAGNAARTALADERRGSAGGVRFR